MGNLQFNSDECLEILNQEQYNKARHLLRNPNKDYLGPFPIYFEHANSVYHGSSIGIAFEPINTWTKEPLTIVSMDIPIIPLIQLI